ICTCKHQRLWRKQFPHSEQEYGFSPVCMRRWVLSAPDSRNRRPQTPHGYGFSPVWMRMCFFKLEIRRKVFPHSKQCSTLHTHLVERGWSQTHLAGLKAGTFCTHLLVQTHEVTHPQSHQDPSRHPLHSRFWGSGGSCPKSWKPWKTATGQTLTD
uniref:Uncharacterized protein n=1 Tax=Pundamilia nyererei TaxID=303518 RepID=A0A3B4GGI5_9CICH